MTENERIKEVRLYHKMSGEDFGARIGITRGALSNIENGNRNVTEQIRKLICKEFRVDYLWLRKGIGDMFFKDDDEITDTLDSIEAILSGESEFAKKMFKMFARYSLEDWKNLEKVITNSAKYLQEMEVSESDTEEED